MYGNHEGKEIMKWVLIVMENWRSIRMAVAGFATLDRLNRLLVGADVGDGVDRGVVKEVVWA